MRKKTHYLPIMAAALLLLVSTSSCYILQQAGPFLRQHLGAEDLERLLADKQTPEDTRAFLLQVREIKSFATEQLGLKQDENYTTYLETEQNYVATVVSACAPYAFEEWQWDYPFLGKMPYKGFYNEKQAQAEITKLEARGLDVWVRRVTAFSSLGYFKDPLFSYMKAYSPYNLANLLIHEQTHATLFFKNHSQFNEELATFIGNTGARLYVKSHYGEDSDTYRQIDRENHDVEVYRNLMAGLRSSLEELYNRRDLEQPAKAKAKQDLIRQVQEDFRAGYDTLFLTENYRRFSDLPINNAYISQFSLYYQDLSLYEQVYELSGCSIPRMLQRLRSLEKAKDPRGVMRTWVTAGIPD